MNFIQLQKAYSNFLLDPDFSKLELLRQKPNIFSALKIVHYENRHSNFLGWLLDPKQTHGLGVKFLKMLLSDIFQDERITNVSVADVARLPLHNAIIYREWNNIDLLIDLDDIIILFENKVRSTEHSNQLANYKSVLDAKFDKKRKVFVFLSPDGYSSSMNEIYVNYSYYRIVYILERLMEVYRSAITPSVSIYIDDYIETLKTHFMSNGDTNLLARQIYLNHKELLNFIFSHTPNPIKELNTYFTKMVAEKGWVKCTSSREYVRFLTPQLHRIIPRNSNAWGHEAFLFEFYIQENGFEFYYTIAPGDLPTRSILQEAIESNPAIEGYAEPDGYLCYSSIEEEVDLNLMNLSDKNFLDKSFNKFWALVVDAVKNAESQIIGKEQNLMALQNS